SIHSYHPCEHEKPGYVDAYWDHSSNMGYVCGDQPKNVFDHWAKSCGYENHEIICQSGSHYSAPTLSPGNNYYNTALSLTRKVSQQDTNFAGFVYDEVDQTYTVNTTPTASLSNTGNAKFTIKLVEQQTILYANKVVSPLMYHTPMINASAYTTADRPHLIVLDNTVCFFKRW
ncbi:MAG: hypothetical protein NC548_45385, partial [Lachnospiraceae bacterium]|nr:hypothetical protein [Lachnospiraceae bacterium]